jgi:hypothetical protein
MHQGGRFCAGHSYHLSLLYSITCQLMTKIPLTDVSEYYCNDTIRLRLSWIFYECSVRDLTKRKSISAGSYLLSSLSILNAWSLSFSSISLLSLSLFSFFSKVLACYSSYLSSFLTYLLFASLSLTRLSRFFERVYVWNLKSLPSAALLFLISRNIFCSSCSADFSTYYAVIFLLSTPSHSVIFQRVFFYTSLVKFSKSPSFLFTLISSSFSRLRILPFS